MTCERSQRYDLFNFIFADLVAERQAAVEAVLKAGHIPAGIGIEPFFLESPMETIKRWIQESDVYILILGGIYGTMIPDESKSYPHWEYDYAGELGKPRFALILTDEALRQKPYDFVLITNHLIRINRLPVAEIYLMCLQNNL